MKLKKELNLLDVFCIASGSMISSGLFILPGLAQAMSGPSVFVAYLIAGLLAATGMLSQAELVSAMPKAGGTYFHSTRSMGPLIGTIDGILTWVSLSLKSAFALVGMAALATLFVSFDIHFIAIALCLIFIILNLVGLKEASQFQIAIVLALLIILGIYVFTGISTVDVRRFHPFAPHGLTGLLGTAGFVFVSFGGLLKVTSIAEEVRDSGHVLPRAMILSLVIVTGLYMIVVMITTGILPAEDIEGSLFPLIDGSKALFGFPGTIVMGFGAALAFIATANAGIMAASRFPLALSRDGLIPSLFGRINSRFGTPHVSVVATGLFMILALFLKIEILVKVTSTILIITYVLSCLSIIFLRESRLQNYQPIFKAPFYPLLQIAGLLGFGALLYNMGRPALLSSLAFILLASAMYWFYGRSAERSEYAFLHLIERLTNKDLTKNLLESELKEIIRERDDIIRDRFDHIIENCRIIDQDTDLPISELLRIVAEQIAPQLNMDGNDLRRQLLERELDSSTAITPQLAIPHLIIPGEKVFDILLVRNRQGIHFSDNAPKVEAVFFLFGSKDERNFHLKALSSIAQIVQEPGFIERWRKAKNAQALRDAILLGKRIRH